MFEFTSEKIVGNPSTKIPFQAVGLTKVAITSDIKSNIPIKF